MQSVDTPTGTTVSVPTLCDVSTDPEPVLTVRLLPGQLPADIVAAAPRLAPTLGAVGLVVEPCPPACGCCVPTRSTTSSRSRPLPRRV